MNRSGHQAVLVQEAVDALVTDRDGFYIDGTFGRGGHSRRILERLSVRGRLLVFDKDEEAIREAVRLQQEDDRVMPEHRSFADIGSCVRTYGVSGRVQGVLLDLGVSSPQLDDAARGFSFMQDGPLDMRMNAREGLTAAQWIAAASEQDMADVFFKYGEERFARRMARAVVEARANAPITRTLELAELIKAANPAWEKHKHPATRVFQAIRIYINNELLDLERALTDILEVLAIGGRLVVISFHSLEDRLVKQFFRDQERGDDFPPDLPVTQAQLNPRLKRVGRVLKVGVQELTANVRSRSAVMRVAEKIA